MGVYGDPLLSWSNDSTRKPLAATILTVSTTSAASSLNSSARRPLTDNAAAWANSWRSPGSTRSNPGHHFAPERNVFGVVPALCRKKLEKFDASSNPSSEPMSAIDRVVKTSRRLASSRIRALMTAFGVVP